VDAKNSTAILELFAQKGIITSAQKNNDATKQLSRIASRFTMFFLLIFCLGLHALRFFLFSDALAASSRLWIRSVPNTGIDFCADRPKTS
jgi:hypothetical protein